VLTVVSKLFNIVQPAVAVFGRKDLQQLTLIRSMTRDLDFPVTILDVETVRESDGLALSSRNRYLDQASRRRAPRIREALLAARAAFESGRSSSADIEATGRSVLAEDSALDVDYFSVVDDADFSTPLSAVRGGSAIVAAVRIGGTRLIDNISL
jgi:pantoate--beta-alanine ligase